VQPARDGVVPIEPDRWLSVCKPYFEASAVVVNAAVWDDTDWIAFGHEWIATIPAGCPRRCSTSRGTPSLAPSSICRASNIYHHPHTFPFSLPRNRNWTEDGRRGELLVRPSCGLHPVQGSERDRLTCWGLRCCEHSSNAVGRCCYRSATSVDQSAWQMELTNCFTEVILEIRLQTIRRTARQSTAQR